MTISGIFKRVLASGACLGITLGAFSCPAVANADPGGGKGEPPGATIGQYDQVSAPFPTGQIASDAQVKSRTAQAYARQKAQQQVTGVGPQAVSSDVLPVEYQTQQTYYWCGPATLSIITRYLGVGWAGSWWDQQNAAANLLGTTTAGTNWYGADNVPNYPGGSWYPMQDALNYLIQGRTFRYDVVGLPGSPSAQDTANFKANLLYDVDHNYPFPINEYAAPGYQIGNQPWQPGMIMHWMAVNGYNASGDSTGFADPGWGNGSISWNRTSGVVVAIGGRGYMP